MAALPAAVTDGCEMVSQLELWAIIGGGGVAR